MAETKVKKSRVYKLATEYNLSSESLVDFLKGKGFKVKNHMSLLNDEMIEAINSHYKKDIEKAENITGKLQNFTKNVQRKQLKKP